MGLLATRALPTKNKLSINQRGPPTFQLTATHPGTPINVMQLGSGEDPKLQSTPKMPPTEEAGLLIESS